MVGLASPLSANAVAYAWRQLLNRAGVGSIGDESVSVSEAVDIPLHYAAVDTVPGSGPRIIVVPSAPECWGRLLEIEPGTLPWSEAGEFSPGTLPQLCGPSLPVLFRRTVGEADRPPCVELRDNGTIVFHVDIVATAFFLLSRWEETVNPTRDAHNRFPARASVAFKQGFLDRPIVDEYALVLREWIKVLRPAWRPAERSFSIRLSHDIDSVRMLPSARSRISALVRSVAQPRYPLNFVEAARALVCDPHLSAIDHLARHSARHGLASAFYFMAAPPSQHDVGYDPTWPPVRKRARQLAADGFEVGFHPGYSTHDNPENFLAEKQRLERAFDLPLRGGRQHVLRFKMPDTFRLWADAGFDYDSTLGFADHEGFRCGTCHEYPPFDFLNDRPFRLLERPLIAMEVTLRKYRRLNVEEASDRICLLADRCRKVGGTFTLLWHNNAFGGEWREWGRAYDRLTASHFAAN